VEVYGVQRKQQPNTIFLNGKGVLAVVLKIQTTRLKRPETREAVDQFFAWAADTLYAVMNGDAPLPPPWLDEAYSWAETRLADPRHRAAFLRKANRYADEEMAEQGHARDCATLLDRIQRERREEIDVRAHWVLAGMAHSGEWPKGFGLSRDGAWVLKDSADCKDGRTVCETVVPITIAPGKFLFAALFRGPEREVTHPLLGAGRVRPTRDVEFNSTTITRPAAVQGALQTAEVACRDAKAASAWLQARLNVHSGHVPIYH
jgi:hypothetical protein